MVLLDRASYLDAMQLPADPDVIPRQAVPILSRRRQWSCDLLRRRPPGRPAGCIPIRSDQVKDPDPATYCQSLVAATGGWPTFNSPDLETVYVWPVRPIDDLTITVRNLSNEASAAQTRVSMSWSEWGIGLPRQQISSGHVDLARSGFSGSEQKISLATPPALKAAGRFGIFAEVVHPYDRDRTNNSGEQTVDGFRTSAGRSQQFVIPIRNPTSVAARIDLRAGPSAVAGWATLAPASVVLNPGAQTNVVATITVPAGVPAAPAILIGATIDILARIGGQLIGGVSILIGLDA
jgi:hypothetical protein